jgi:hypothetical protein
MTKLAEKGDTDGILSSHDPATVQVSVIINPLFPALRSGPTARSGASPKSKILAADFVRGWSALSGFYTSPAIFLISVAAVFRPFRRVSLALGHLAPFGAGRKLL